MNASQDHNRTVLMMNQVDATVPCQTIKASASNLLMELATHLTAPMSSRCQVKVAHSLSIAPASLSVEVMVGASDLTCQMPKIK